MKKFRMETTVGVFVLIGILCIGYMSIKLGDVSIFGDNSYSLFAKFSSVAGLKTGSSVEMLGIDVGKVASLVLDQEKQQAVVELRIQNNVVVYDDAIASIKTAGLIGDKYVQIDPGGGGDVLKQGAGIVDTNSPLDIESLIGKIAFGSIDEKKE
jgi:phospholipid/cholesterol/gamma-HCH transport system substrate-binding protein